MTCGRGILVVLPNLLAPGPNFFFFLLDNRGIIYSRGMGENKITSKENSKKEEEKRTPAKQWKT